MIFTKRLFFSLLLVGLLAGFSGVSLSLLLHFVQHQAYGYSAHESFRLGTEAASPERRLLVVSCAGVLVGLGWWALKRFAKPLVSLKASMSQPLQGLPFVATVCHVLLQMVTVGMGSPLGREVAPRELSAAFATVWIKRMGLSEEEARLLLACAAGAGLAAVYNVPMAGVLFTLETLLVMWSPTAISAALLTSVVATAVSRIGLGDLVQYHPTHVAMNMPLLCWAALMGPLIGALVVLFQRTMKPFPMLARGDKRLVLLAMVAFVLIGVLSIYFPAILGNGKAGNQLTFEGIIGWQDSLALMMVKWLAVLLALAAGAYGGLITPSMMMGSTFALAAAFAWNYGLPPISVEAAALVGAAAFLGVSLNMPVTSLIFMLELTRVSSNFLLPMGLCMAGAVLFARWLNEKNQSLKAQK